VVPHWIQNQAQGNVTRWYDNSGHYLPLDKQGAEMAHDIADSFLDCNLLTEIDVQKKGS